MYYNGCLSILALFRLNCKLFLENIKKFKEMLSSCYKVTFIPRKITHNPANFHYKRGQKWKFFVYYWNDWAKMSVLLKIDGYYM